MALFREPQTCFKCGGTLEGKYQDQSHLPAPMQLIGDTFLGWDYEGHTCPVTILVGDSDKEELYGIWKIKYKVHPKLIDDKTAWCKVVEDTDYELGA